MYLCMYVHMYVYMYVFMIYIHLHTYIPQLMYFAAQLQRRLLLKRHLITVNLINIIKIHVLDFFRAQKLSFTSQTQFWIRWANGAQTNMERYNVVLYSDHNSFVIKTLSGAMLVAVCVPQLLGHALAVCSSCR